MMRYRPRCADDEGASLIMTMVFVTGVGLVVAALLTYGAGVLSSASLTAKSAQAQANVAGALQTAINEVRNSVYVNDGVTPCLGAGNRRTYPPLASAGLPTTVTCGPDPASGAASGASVPINPQNRPLGALLTLGTYSSGAAPGVPPADPTGVTVTPPGGPAGTAVVVTGSGFDRVTAIQVGTTAEIATAKATTMTPCPNGVDAAGCFTANGNTLTVSQMPVHVFGNVEVKVITLGTAASAAFSYLTPPNAPAKPGATAGQASAAITWVAPIDGGSAITGYVITPTRNGVDLSTVAVGATPTSATLSGLTVGASYTFTVTAVNAIGIGAESPSSSAVVPYAVIPGAPTIGTASAGTLAATASWSAPANDGGSPVTGYVVTPYLGGVTAQTARTFASTVTTQVITGLTAGSAYTFKVSAKTAIGTGPLSAASNSVTINANPVLTFGSLPGGRVGFVYTTTTLSKTGGTAPYVWSISAGTFPPGLTLAASTGVISGKPTVSGTFSFTVKVVDAYGASATKAASIVVAVAKMAPPVGVQPGDGLAGDHVAATDPGGSPNAVEGAAPPPAPVETPAPDVPRGARTTIDSPEQLHAVLRESYARRMGLRRRRSQPSRSSFTAEQHGGNQS